MNTFSELNGDHPFPDYTILVNVYNSLAYHLRIREIFIEFMDRARRIITLLHRKKILFFVPLLFCIPSLLTVIDNELVLFPLRDTYTYFCYSDSTEGIGNSSVITCTADSSRIIFEYVLRNGVEYPYAGIQIDVNKDSTFLDISDYDHLHLTIEAHNLQKVAVYLKTYIKGFTTIADFNTHRFCEKECDLTEKRSRYSLALDEFVTAAWWLNENHLSETEIGPPDLTRVLNIAIANADYAEVDTRYSMVITRISFTKDIRRAAAASGTAVLLYFLIYWFVVFMYKGTGPPVVIPYKELQVTSYIDEEAGRIIERIAQRYNDSTISVAKIGEEAGVLPARIPVILKKKFNCTFKQYLNTIRLTEAKRLLRETDRQIADVAYAVGYRNVTHFHRIFKQYEKISPNEYRKSNTTLF